MVPAVVYKDRQVVAQLVQRAEAAGYQAIALTVDAPILGRRYDYGFDCIEHGVIMGLTALSML